MFTKALVPLDGSEVSGGIIPFVTQFAHGLNMGVTLATAIELDPTRSAPFRGIAGGFSEPTDLDSLIARSDIPNELKEKIDREVKRPLDELADRMALEGIPTDTKVALGPASETIIQMAQDCDCDLIAMSTKGRSVLGSGLLGSVTYKVMHESPMPILAITPERARQNWGTDYAINRIIVPLDGSELAEAALPYSAFLAGGMNMSVTLMHAHPLDDFLYSDGFMISDAIPQAQDEMAAEMRRYLHGIASELRNEGLTVNTETTKGKPSTEIAALARKTDHSMIALATHGRSGMSRLLLGSVAEAVVRESGDPVLIVRSSAAVTPTPAATAAPVS